MSEKLQKILARVGVGSRRQCEQWIAEGRIKVNSLVAKLGDRVTLADQIHIDDVLLPKYALEPQKTKVIIYHKPEGQICSRKDPENRPTVFEHLPVLSKSRWVSIGRLDFNTSGLLLLTNDGELANQLMHPSYEIEREYAVRIYGAVTKLMIKNLKLGVQLEDGLAKFDSIEYKGGDGKNAWYHVVLREGRNREVRRLWESQGAYVSRLIRVRFGPITLPPLLRPGRWTALDAEQIAVLSGHDKKNKTA